MLRFFTLKGSHSANIATVCLPLAQRAKEDVLQKEVKVKILKDSINLLVSRTSPPVGRGSEELTSELEGVLANYQKLCDRFKSKCHTLEVMCVCVWGGVKFTSFRNPFIHVHKLSVYQFLLIG